MKPTIIDLFSGCGGVTQGFKNQGFQVLAAVEWDFITAQTYRENHPEVVMYEDDIRNVQPKKILTTCGLQQGELTVLSVCAPCQPFSRQNRLQKEDSRTKLVLETIGFTAALQPKYILMENVPGLNKGKNKKILDELISILQDDLNYRVTLPHVVNAVNYGVPQFRKRLILLCSREDIVLQLPDPTHVSSKEVRQTNKPEWRTVRDAFQGIHRLSAGQKSRTDVMHRARSHGDLVLERLKHIPKNGGSRHSLPEHLQLACHKKTKTGFYDVYGRMKFERPSNTLTTGCTNFTKGRFAHPTANRAITPREAARLQTFPDNYKFIGNYGQISTQIGNAVPVELAEVFAKYFCQLEQ
ncbi:DNA cytosine methyltransferase [Anaerolineales bacterium HSG6]|nr:DNA cytosine methyltransferase [Anaerolineales bacterium HSG6]